MKPRHTAALALAGWYLMVPPMYGHHEIDGDAPLSEWQIVESFDTAEKCSAYEVKLKIRNSPRWRVKRVSLGACIASDDPRLKGD
jgi:hypothetical protein